MFLELQNEISGKKVRVKFRPFRPEDAPSVVRCIRSEYGDTYFKRDFYRTSTLIQEQVNGHMLLLVAQSDICEIVGMLVLKRFRPREDMCEIASQIFLPEYRGFHIAWPFFQYGMELIDRMEDVSAAYCLPVVFHPITQVLMERIGLTPCGFFFGAFRMEKIRHSYPRDKNRKHPQGIMVQAKQRKDAGLLHVPKVHRIFIEGIYRALGAQVRVDEAVNPLKGVTELFWENDSNQRSCAIHVDRAGADLSHRIRTLQKQYRGVTDQTFNILLNVSDESAPAAYEVLLDLGFYFSGLQPLCSSREIMVLHNPGSVPLHMDTLALTPRSRAVADYIAPFYAKRK